MSYVKRVRYNAYALLLLNRLSRLEYVIKLHSNTRGVYKITGINTMSLDWARDRGIFNLKYM